MPTLDKHMRKSLIIFCFIWIAATAARAQTSLPKQYLDVIGNLVGSVPTRQPAAQLIGFAKKLIGVPYRYASSNPNRGFDCSGFVNYVFESCGIDVPRSSPEFVHTGKPVALSEAKVGDVLIFTGSNPKIRRVGHVGIIYSIDGDDIKFIHSSSGKANGVTVTALEGYYKTRFIKAVSII